MTNSRQCSNLSRNRSAEAFRAERQSLLSHLKTIGESSDSKANRRVAGFIYRPATRRFLFLSAVSLFLCSLGPETANVFDQRVNLGGRENVFEWRHGAFAVPDAFGERRVGVRLMPFRVGEIGRFQTFKPLAVFEVAFGAL